LSDDETALLLAGLLGKPVLAAESQQTLLERAGGNPLYAEQFAELYVERGSTEELPLPETLQGIIAARLDGLAETEKDLVLDAAVVGKVFWAGSLGRRNSNDVVSTLHLLERKGFVRRQRRSSVEGETELAFAHALVRDVAYGQIPRAERAAKHRRVAEWIESLGRPEDHAEMVVHHWQAALELARAAGEDGGNLAERTRIALRAAGDRAFALNAYPMAEKYYADALALWFDADPERPDLLFRRSRSLHLAGDDRRQAALEEARDALLVAGAAEPAAEAEAFLGSGAWYRGDRDAAEPHFSRAYALVADRGATSSKARVLAFSARFRMLAGVPEEAIRVAQEALALAEELSLDELRAHALTTIGSSKSRIELASGRPELEQALDIALAADSPIAAVTMNNLAVLAIWEGDFRRGCEIYPEAQKIAERFGDRDGLRFMRGNEIFGLWVIGRWDDAAAAADEYVAECAAAPHYAEGIVREARASIRLARGDLAGAAEDREFVLAHAHRVKDPQRILPTLAATAVSLVLLEKDHEARTVAEETLALTRENVDMTGAVNFLVLIGRRLGIRDDLRKIVALAPEGPWKDLVIAGTDGDLRRVGDLYASFSAPTFEAYARLFGGEELIDDGHREEGEAELERALAFFRSVGAKVLVSRAEGLLGEAYSDSA
jgi:tetratricopeptide (TPR) repeat protein